MKNNLSIKVKMIILFIMVKVLPLLLIAYLAIIGINSVGNIFITNLENNFENNKSVLKDVANKSIDDSIEALDKIAQESIEKLTVLKANQVAEFLYERDDDLLFLSKLPLSNNLFEQFFYSKTKEIIVEPKYIYDDTTSKWIIEKKSLKNKQARVIIPPKENERNFNFYDTKSFPKEKIQIYKEITFVDLKGQEIYKKSKINSKLLDISKKENTYVNSENYFSKLKFLQKDEIYVSTVIGKYVSSKILGDFTKEKAKKAGLDFKPENHGYAGKENPKGKKFDGIIRFATPYFKNNIKIGYITLALDHRHIMEFSDYFDPISKDLTKQISDASDGDYAFINDYKYRMISHPKDYHISGFNENTGKRASPWLSEDLAKKFKNSKIKDINLFLEDYPKFEDQSSNKKPNMEQIILNGEAVLDCRYLNFAPQCTSFKKITQYGGYGSTLIKFSNLWKLTTTASIPYFTGQYGNTKVGFGTFGISTNIDQFHLVANKTRKQIDTILENEEKTLHNYIINAKDQIKLNIQTIIQELTYFTLVLIILIIFIAIWLANYLTNRIKTLTDASQKISQGDFDIKFESKSNDEISQLENTFEYMANTLSNKVKNRTRQIEREKDKALQATKSKSEFLANMSHEIRTPMNGIIGITQLVSETELTEKQSRYIQTITSSSYTLLNILNDILDFSKIEAGKLTIEKVDFNLHDMMRNIKDIVKFKAKEKGLKLEIIYQETLPYSLHGDNLRISQVLINLINNAIKFTDRGFVKVQVKNLEKNLFTFSIEDSGIGINEEKISKLFQSFSQEDSSTTRRYGGTGLGLSISKQLVELMDGKIWCESIKNIGSKFIFQLELSHVKENITTIQDKKVSLFDLQSLKNTHILLVEDNIINQDIILGLLENTNIEIDIAINGKIAVDMFNNDTDKYSLILMDIQMPVMSGYEATKLIRELNHSIPIIALTANAMKEDKEKTQAVGMDGHLNKPIEVEKLYETLLKYLSNK